MPGVLPHDLPVKLGVIDLFLQITHTGILHLSIGFSENSVPQHLIGNYQCVLKFVTTTTTSIATSTTDYDYNYYNDYDYLKTCWGQIPIFRHTNFSY